jgi:hypothetical protein
MSEFDFNAVALVDDYEWPKRGRVESPLPAALIKILHKSYEEGSVASMVIKNDSVGQFARLLSKAGRQFNMRIERDVRKDHPNTGQTTYSFRAKVKNSNKEH